MKRFFLILLTLTAFSFIAAAQSLDRALEQLEIVRLKNGEQSHEYLSALDTVILKANMAGETQTAFTYRKKHLDIEKQMKGNESVEVADDLWRLGNTSCMLGDTVVACEYYYQSYLVFNNSIDFEKDMLFAPHYLHCVWSLLTLLPGDKEKTQLFSKKLAEVSQKIYGAGSCDHLSDLLLAALYNEIVENHDGFRYYCQQTIDNCKEIDSCNYTSVDAAYRYLKSYYFHLNQNDLQIAVAIEHLNKLESAKNDFFNEIVNALQYLMVCDIKDAGAAIAYGKRAEQMLYDSYHSKQALYQDTVYYNIVSHLALLYDMTHDYVQGLSYHQLICEIKEHNGTDNTVDYYMAVSNYFDCASEAGESQLVMALANKIEPLIFQFSNTPIEDAYNYALNMFNATSSLGRYDEALYYCDELLNLSIQLHGDSCWIEQADLLLSKAEISMNMGAMQKAHTFVSQSKSALSLVPSITESDYGKFVQYKAYNIEGQLLSDYEEAIMKFDSAMLICEELINEAKSQLPNSNLDSISLSYDDSFVQADVVITIGKIKEAQKAYAITLGNKGSLLYKHGAIKDSYNCFTMASSITENLKSSSSIEYLSCQNNVAMCLMNMGRYSDAINILDNNLRIVKSVYGTNHPLYPICLQNHGVYYLSIGNYLKTHEYLNEAASYSKTIFGESSERYAQSLMNIGASYLSLGNYSEALSYLKEAQSVYENTNVTPDAMCLLYRNLSNVLIGLGEKEEGEKHYNMAKEMIEATWGKYSAEYAELVASYGWMLDDYEKAFDCFLEASGIFLSIGYTYHPSCIRSLICYGSAGIMLLGKPLVSDYIQITTETVKDYYYNNLSFYSEDDRCFVWQYLFGVKNTVFSARTNNLSDSYLFNYILFSKSLMLSTSDSFKKAILVSGQQHLIDQFNDIQSLQRAIDNQSFGLSMENQPTEQLYDRKNSMERRLLAEMKSLGYSINDSITYNDIRRSLKDNEIAIEFVDYYHLKDKKTYYLALLAKSSWGNPVYVLLCTEVELKDCIGNPNVTYSVDDLYRLLWQPLTEYIYEGDKVYFSLSGMLHTIALESLHTPDGSCLSDKYNLIRLTSTRELCKERRPKSYETGAIYGGLQYDVDQQRMTDVAEMNKTATEDSPVFALRGEDRGNWNFLQGTKDEVEHIAGIMRQANIGCELFEGDLGNEESFKALSGTNTDIIHLATHGYFLEGEKADMNDFMKSLSPLARQKTDSIIDPLLRSGLILAGGNRAWLGQEVPEGIEDGVLTALEISTMNLSGTDMVVMSACETGLGDITSDGVFGLQRAFKMAGVQTLVMSLWKVDDNATSLMMQTFYEHLLSGMSKREAFNLAQAVVRAKYPEPYYWAGFVMLD